MYVHIQMLHDCMCYTYCTSLGAIYARLHNHRCTCILGSGIFPRTLPHIKMATSTLIEGPEEFTCFLSLGGPFELGYVRIDGNKSEFLAFVSSGLVHRLLSVAIWALQPTCMIHRDGRCSIFLRRVHFRFRFSHDHFCVHTLPSREKILHLQARDIQGVSDNWTLPSSVTVTSGGQPNKVSSSVNLCNLLVVTLKHNP